jgi:hypothetical protein
MLGYGPVIRGLKLTRLRVILRFLVNFCFFVSNFTFSGVFSNVIQF